MNFLELASNYSPVLLRSFIEANQHHIQGVSNFLDQEKHNSDQGLQPRITPRIELVLSPYHLVSMDPYDLFPHSLKVIFMFQDPYPTPGEACGVATASLTGKIPMTLNNIFKRLSETYTPTPSISDGDIRGWCTQGVLPINIALTTREKEIEVHIDEWSLFSQQMIRWISDRFPYLIFVLFGKKAQLYKKYINAGKHLVIETSHPSGRGYFYGFDKSNIFNEINEQLTLNKRSTIQWEKISYIENS